MESGDIIDAHLEQVRTVFTSPAIHFLKLPSFVANSSEDDIDTWVLFLLVPSLNSLSAYMYDSIPTMK